MQAGCVISYWCAAFIYLFIYLYFNELEQIQINILDINFFKKKLQNLKCKNQKENQILTLI